MSNRCGGMIRTGVQLVLLCCVFLGSGCATTRHSGGELPPILMQDELLRPYQKIGIIEVHRERYGSPADLSPSDYNWGYQALREEAAKIGADAVIFPEVKAEQETYILFPTSEMKAKGVAIKFR
jgi:hypothetical protein